MMSSHSDPVGGEGAFLALVVGGVDYGEADRVVHLLTRFGRVAVFAHGAKKSRRRFAGALELFTTIRAETTTGRKNKRGMPTLTGATVVGSRLPLRRSLEQIALASYVAELSARVAPEGEDSEELFALVCEVFDDLLERDATLSVRRAFELRLIHVMGYAPELERCVVCRQEAQRLFIDLTRGGLTCIEHRQDAPEIGPKTLAWMTNVLASRAFEPTGGYDAEWSRTAARKLSGATERFLNSLLDRPLKAVSLLDTVQL